MTASAAKYILLQNEVRRMKNLIKSLFVLSAVLVMAACGDRAAEIDIYMPLAVDETVEAHETEEPHENETSSDWISVSNPLASHSLQVPPDWSFNFREAWGGFQIFGTDFSWHIYTNTYSWGDNSTSDFVPLDTDDWPGDVLLNSEQAEDFVFDDGNIGIRSIQEDYTLFARINETRGEVAVLFISIEDAELTNLIGATLTESIVQLAEDDVMPPPVELMVYDITQGAEPAEFVRGLGYSSFSEHEFLSHGTDWIVLAANTIVHDLRIISVVPGYSTST